MPSARLAWVSDPEIEDQHEADAWPVRCEVTALVLTGVLGLLVAAAALFAADFPIGTGTAGGPGLVAHLRWGEQYLSPIDGLVAVGATALVAFDGLTSGERRGASTLYGKIALWGTGVLAALVALATAVRGIDVLAGHFYVNAPAIPGRPGLRVGGAADQWATAMPAGVACWGVWKLLEDTDVREVADEVDALMGPLDNEQDPDADAES